MWITREELEEELGVEEARAFLALHRGQQLSIPKQLRSSSLLIKQVGLEMAKRLSKTYAGLVVSIPNPQTSKTAKQTIIELLREGGHSLNEIAFISKVTLRYVAMVKREWKAGELGTYS